MELKKKAFINWLKSMRKNKLAAKKTCFHAEGCVLATYLRESLKLSNVKIRVYRLHYEVGENMHKLPAWASKVVKTFDTEFGVLPHPGRKWVKKPTAKAVLAALQPVLETRRACYQEE